MTLTAEDARKRAQGELAASKSADTEERERTCALRALTWAILAASLAKEERS